MGYIARQAALSVDFSRQEYWSRLPCPSPGESSDSGIEPRSPALWADSLLFELLRKKWLWRGVGEGCGKKWLCRMRDSEGKRQVFSIEAWSHEAGALSLRKACASAGFQYCIPVKQVLSQAFTGCFQNYSES